MYNYSFPSIAKLIRAQYADNMINLAAELGAMAKHDAAYYANQYFNTKLTKLNAKGNIECCCAKYMNEIYNDIYKVTRVNLLDYYEEDSKGNYVRRSNANIRKRLLNITYSYNNKTGKAYEPTAEYKEMIVKYLGCSSWEQLCDNAEDLLEEMEENLNWIAEGTVQPSVENVVISPKTISQCHELNICFTDGGKIALFALGDCQFRIVKTEETGFSKGDIVNISDRIIVGNRLALEIVNSKDYHFCSLWLSPVAIRRFSVKEPYTRMIA